MKLTLLFLNCPIKGYLLEESVERRREKFRIIQEFFTFFSLPLDLLQDKQVSQSTDVSRGAEKKLILLHF